MYRISVTTGGVEYPLHEPYGDDVRAIAPVLTSSMDTVGSLAFQLAAVHPYVGMLKPLESEFYVYDDDDEIIFCGRMVKPVKDYYNSVSVTCEGELAYLIDSIQNPYEFTGTAQEFLTELLRVHNSQVEARKQFVMGQVNVTVEAGTVFSGSDYTTTLSELKGLMEASGGHPRIRHVGGKRYLDLVSDYGGINSQVIRFGENMLDMSQYQDATKVFTRLIPTGADIDYQDENGATQTRRLDITSVNGGSNCIEHTGGISMYGRITGSKRWDDVTDPEMLLSKAKAYLDECVAMPETLEIKAIDLALIDVDVQKLKLGYWTAVESIPHDMEKQFLLTKKEMHLDDPGKDRVLLGQTLSSFTGNTVKQQSQVSARIEKVASNASKEINRKVENATQLITGGLGGYVVLDVYDPSTGEKTHPWRILIMDTPDKNTAKSVIQINKNGIGFSTTGILGPYRSAWTIDGNFLADFITTGTMLSERIRGGIYEVGGSGLARDGRIVIKNISDDIIGYWDKTGLHVLLGIIEGSTIKGSDIIGGTINIGNGTFSVDDDGAVVINAGKISIGGITLTEYYADLGAFRVSNSEYGVLYSVGGGIIIHSEESKLDSGPAIEVTKGSMKTRIGYGGIKTNDIAFYDSWTEGMSALDMLKDLYDRTNRLDSRIDGLEG